MSEPVRNDVLRPNPPPWGRADGRSPRARLPLDGDTTTTVAVLGAGITGLTAAYELARAGLDVRVLEARHLAAGATGASTAKITVLHGLAHQELARRWDLDVASAHAAANREGFEWLVHRVDELDIACDLERRPAATYARTRAGARAVEAEVQVAQQVGLPVRLERELDVPHPITAAVVLDDQVQLDPVAYLRRLAAGFEAEGGRLHEGTPAQGLDGQGRIVTETGVVTAEHVLVCTGIPFLDRTLAFARLEPLRSYCLAARVRGPRPRTMSISADGPTRSLRTMPDPDGDDELLVVGGAGHVVGREPNTEQRYDELATWTDDHFGLEEVAWRWSTQDYRPIDGLPLVGRTWGLPEQVRIATGYAKWGLTKGTAAGLALAGDVLGSRPAWIEPFDARRVDAVRAPAAFGALNGKVAWHLVADLVAAAARPRTAVAEGEGVVVRTGLADRTAVARVGGRVCAVSGVCPHLGGTLAWNPAERSWDCPLHGSRFAADGALLQGPAVKDLRPHPVPDGFSGRSAGPS